MDNSIQARKLCCIEPWHYRGVEISILSVVDSSSSAVRLCRDLVTERNDVFASPHSFNHVQVVMMSSLRSDPTLQEILKKVGLVFAANNCTRSPTVDEIRHCLNFTLSCRLSPLWNSVGPWMVRREQDQYFLAMADDDIPFQSVKVDVRNIGIHTQAISNFIWNAFLIYRWMYLFFNRWKKLEYLGWSRLASRDANLTQWSLTDRRTRRTF